ncbi:hypothetical protein POTOM_003673 [Populus tomentosa]|uniref:Nucleoporin protein Ndc1-Nup n=1 Tax=Populus tomentosa TaxID=118781 RepID=A0A8X8AUF4_POPTO|nr:hypothetical protein POTOM_003673 [Populus tomentosa]
MSPPPELVSKNRFLGFLIWQTFTSSTIYFLTKLFLLAFFTTPKFSPSQLCFSLLKFFTFTFSNLLFSSSLSILSSPQSLPYASPLQLAAGLVRFAFVSSPAEPEFRRRALVSARFVVFVVVAGISGALSVVCLCGFDGFELIARLGFRGFVFGVLYGLFDVYKKRWVLEFPIIQYLNWIVIENEIWVLDNVEDQCNCILDAFIGLLLKMDFGVLMMRKTYVRIRALDNVEDQCNCVLDFCFGLLLKMDCGFLMRKTYVRIVTRPLFYSFKMGLPLAIKRALKLSNVAYLFLSVLQVFLPEQFKSGGTMGQFITEQIILYIGSFSMVFCWELSHHLHQVLHTKRFLFAPPKGSAAAETNPSEPLLAALEESIPDSLPQYLAYLDLCMVCENNVDTWRRAAFFEETGETYKRVVAACLRPLEQLASNLSEGLEGCFVDKAHQLSNQLQSPTDSQRDSRHCEPLNNFQKYAWCARAVASLTAWSHEEDRFGVAQLTGSNAAVTSTLISSLLAVEAFMGKKTSLQPQHLMGPAAIKWNTPNTGRRDVVTTKKQGGPLHAKAYAMADVLRTSVYSIVSTFHDEMFTSNKAGLLEKDWVLKSKPLFGTYELLVQKLHHFLDYRAN